MAKIISKEDCAKISAFQKAFKKYADKGWMCEGGEYGNVCCNNLFNNDTGEFVQADYDGNILKSELFQTTQNEILEMAKIQGNIRRIVEGEELSKAEAQVYKRGVVFDIEWDVDMDEVFERLDAMTTEKAAEALNVREAAYASMTEENRQALAYDVFRHCPTLLNSLFDLPNTVTLPDGVEDDDAADWLSDTYGYCVSSYEIRPEYNITLDVVRKAYRKGVIRLADSPNGDGVVCRIGDGWFYFGGMEAESSTVEEYAANVPEEDIVREIHEAIEGIGKDLDADEYNYYGSVLDEAGCMGEKLPDDEAQMDYHFNNLLWETLLKHKGHNVRIVTYGDPDDPADVCLECEDCGEVILDAEIYTLCAREDN